MIKIGKKSKLPKDASINYVIATWSGPRRVKDHRYNLSRDFYINEHLKRIRDLKSTYVNQITIAIPENPVEPSYYRDKIPSSINGIPVIIFERPNMGLSYGSFSDVYSRYSNDFDYYILMEDDYVFAMDNYDGILLKAMMDNFHMIASPKNKWNYAMQNLGKPTKCGFVCGYYTLSHAAIFLGLADSSAMAKVWTLYNKLPHGEDNTYSSNELQGQVGQSTGYLHAGYVVRDVLHKYKVGFRTPDMNIRWYGSLTNPTLMEPI